jgi:hypothetical protein
MQRFFLRKVGHSSRGIRKTQNQERNNILPLLFDLEREPDDAAELHIHRQCIAISEKHFAHSHRFNSIRSWLKDLFQQLLDNSNIVMKEKLMMQVISPQEDLLPEVKLALKRKKAVFGDCSEDIVAVMSRMEIYLCYDLVNTLAFEFCWRARGQLKRKPNNRGCDFYEDYKQQRAKISIRQIIKRIELAFSTLIL